ncbi:MAG: hypothetical protein JXA33_09140 [Anaerolineae bacterium]|nr:hypothetical protein [Anaerolineae bacterium]
MSKFWVIVLSLIVLSVLVIGVVGGLTFLGQLVRRYPLKTLVEEGYTMNECATCHETEKFHTCDTCHDDHGAIEFEEVPFYAVVAFVGDVPEPGYLLIDDILPYREQPHTYVPLLTFLETQEVTDFESVTLASEDEGFVTIAREDLTAEAWLMPYEDGIRFAAPDLHISTWIKGIRRIIVVGQEMPLVIEGQATSIGRLLLGPTRSVTTEQTDVMFKSEEDGKVRKAQTASRIEGAALEAVVARPDFVQLTVNDGAGNTHTFTAEEVRGAILYQMHNQVTLVLPARGRTQWVQNVVEVTSK